MAIALRLATIDDIPALTELIPLSVRKLQAAHYSEAQIEAALVSVFGVDTQLIADGTYFVAEEAGKIVGCGGWSKRKTLFGGDRQKDGVEDTLLDPRHDAARIRAFFVHPEFSRRGIGLLLMEACEQAAIDAHFTEIELVATLAGEHLYAAFHYMPIERFDIPLPNGLGLPVVKMNKYVES